MRIGIDLRPVAKQRAGIGVFLAGLARYLPQAGSGDDYFAFLGDYAELPEEAQGYADPGINAKGWLWHNKVASALKKGKVDLYLTTSAFVPSMAKNKCVLICCDMTPFVYPQFHTLKVRFANLFMRRAAVNSLRVITISRHSAKDIAKYLRIPQEKIDIAYPGVDERFFEPVTEEKLKGVRKKYSLPENFLLFVGSLEPRKNISCVLRAMARLKEEGEKDTKLVVAGGAGWRNSAVFADMKKLGLADSVTFTGYIDSADLPALYRLAEIFVFPSFYEGFGLPVVEAMASGVPVVASNASSIPEALGEAGISFGPEDDETLAVSIKKICGSPDLKTELVEKGLQQAKKFKWASCAAAINNVIVSLKKNKPEKI